MKSLLNPGLTKIKIAFIISAVIMANQSFSQKADTLEITAANVNTKVLIPGTHQYLIYFKNGTDSSRINFQFWTRTLEFTKHTGKEAILITQVWEDNKAIIHKTKSYCERRSFAPLYHESWWQGRGMSTFDFTDKSASLNGTPLTETDTTRRRTNTYNAFKKSMTEYNLNWHLDLEVFPTLPYKPHVTFSINFYDPGSAAPSRQFYVVSGSESIVGYGGQVIDCWILRHESKFGKEKFWISKKTKEVLKLEQVMANGTFRYKVKLGFSV